MKQLTVKDMVQKFELGRQNPEEGVSEKKGVVQQLRSMFENEEGRQEVRGVLRSSGATGTGGDDSRRRLNTLFGKEDDGHRTKWGAKSLGRDYPKNERIGKKKTTNTCKMGSLGPDEEEILGATSETGKERESLTPKADGI